MNDTNLRHRAFKAMGLGEALHNITDLTEKQQLELLKIAIRERESLYNAQFIAQNGLKYVRIGMPDRIQSAFDSGFIPPGDIQKLLQDEDKALD